MVLKTSYKITFLLSLIHNYIGSLQACLQRHIRKAFKTFFFELGLECLPAQGEAPFLFRNLDGLKGLVGRIAACACLCKFSACTFSALPIFEFFPCFDHEHGKGPNNHSHHLFVFSCSEYLQCLSLKKYYICSLGVNFLPNSC